MARFDLFKWWFFCTTLFIGVGLIVGTTRMKLTAGGKMQRVGYGSGDDFETVVSVV